MVLLKVAMIECFIAIKSIKERLVLDESFVKTLIVGTENFTNLFFIVFVTQIPFFLRTYCSMVLITFRHIKSSFLLPLRETQDKIKLCNFQLLLQHVSHFPFDYLRY